MKIFSRRGRTSTADASASCRHHEGGVARFAASMSVREAREIVEREAARWYASAHAHSNINAGFSMEYDNGEANCWLAPRVPTEEHQRIAAARRVLGPRRIAEIDRPYLAAAAEAVRRAAQQRPAEIAARARARATQRARQVLTEHTDRQRLAYQRGEMSAIRGLDSRDWEAALQVIRREPDRGRRQANLRALGAARAVGVLGITQTDIDAAILWLSPSGDRDEREIRRHEASMSVAQAREWFARDQQLLEHWATCMYDEDWVDCDSCDADMTAYDDHHAAHEAARRVLARRDPRLLAAADSAQHEAIERRNQARVAERERIIAATAACMSLERAREVIEQHRRAEIECHNERDYHLFPGSRELEAARRALAQL